MPPVNHMKPSEDEIIAHIKDSIAAYEENYVPGSWERFNKQESRKPGMIILLSRISSAAAVVVIGILLFWFSSRDTKVLPEEAPKVTAQDTREMGSDDIEPTASGAKEAAAAKFEGANTLSPTLSDPPAVTVPGITPPVRYEIPASTGVTSAIVKAETTVASNNVGPAAKPEPEAKLLSIEEFLKGESTKGIHTASNIKNTENKDRWEVGVVVSPSFGNTKKINMGYGVSMGYSLTDKLSLNSGLSYNEMAASRSVGHAGAAVSAIAGENKSLESIEQKVTGLDIPLDIKYNISKNLYANVGVSAFAVLDQRQNNNYVQERVVERAYSAPAGSKEYTNLIVNEKVTETAPPSEIDKDNYIGFYNFSFGYKQKVSKDKSISIEPFMKVPMKEVTRDNLRLMGTGVKLRFDF